MKITCLDHLVRLSVENRKEDEEIERKRKGGLEEREVAKR